MYENITLKKVMYIIFLRKHKNFDFNIYDKKTYISLLMRHKKESTTPPVSMTSTKNPKNKVIIQKDTDIGIIEIKPGMYGFTNPKKT